MYRFIRMALMTATAAMVLIGCATTTGPGWSYPPGWPPLERGQIAGGCPEISGTYANKPSGSSPEVIGAPRLTEVFARMDRYQRLAAPTRRAWEVPGDAVSATFQLDPESLTVHFTGDDGATSSLLFRKLHFISADSRVDDKYVCSARADAPRLEFFAGLSQTDGLMYMYMDVSSAGANLLKASDGSLIVQWYSSSARMSLWVLGSQQKIDSVWFRYPNITGRH